MLTPGVSLIETGGRRPHNEYTDSRCRNLRHSPDIGRANIDSPGEAGGIRSLKPGDTDRQRLIRLPEQTVVRLEQLQKQTRRQSITELVVEAVEQFASMHAAADFAHQWLTPRHLEVLRLVAEGVSTKGIAAQLGISVKTAEFHRAALMRKLGVHGIAGLVRYAIRAGVILP